MLSESKNFVLGRVLKKPIYLKRKSCPKLRKCNIQSSRYVGIALRCVGVFLFWSLWTPCPEARDSLPRGRSCPSISTCPFPLTSKWRLHMIIIKLNRYYPHLTENITLEVSDEIAVVLSNEGRQCDGYKHHKFCCDNLSDKITLCKL